MRNRIQNADIDFELHSAPVLEQSSLGTTSGQDNASTSADSVREEGAAAVPAGGFPEISAERLAMLLRTDSRDDSDVRCDVLRALMMDSLVPLSVDAQVQDGIVSLTGTVSWHRERNDAMYLTGSVPGVLGVIDNLVLIPAPRDGDGH
jgi:osmotically-inducible protein OsmY